MTVELILLGAGDFLAIHEKRASTRRVDELTAWHFNKPNGIESRPLTGVRSVTEYKVMHIEDLLHVQ
jgi:hypothetical protein